jgi:hypothetical protein
LDPTPDKQPGKHGGVFLTTHDESSGFFRNRIPDPSAPALCDVAGQAEIPDCVCNMRDIGYVASEFGSSSSHLQWDPDCDVTSWVHGVQGGKIEMRDIGEACINFGRT